MVRPRTRPNNKFARKMSRFDRLMLNRILRPITAKELRDQSHPDQMSLFYYEEWSQECT